MTEPGFCDRCEHRDEQGRGRFSNNDKVATFPHLSSVSFFDEESESAVVSAVELYEDKKVRHCSSNAASYRKFRVDPHNV